MKRKPRVSTCYPRNRLTALITRPGGTRRDKAVAEAMRRVESHRRPTLAQLDLLISRLEEAVAAKGRISTAELEQIGELADRIVSLALLFGLESLAEAAMRLCDLGFAFVARGQIEFDPIAVHVRALRLLGPGGTRLAQAEEQDILAGLRRLLDHFGGTA